MGQQIVEYNITDAAIAKMESVYMGLTITDIENKEEFQSVHDARMVVKGKRLDVEKKRKELKADSLAWGRQVDSEAKRIKGLLEPIEGHLQIEENKVIDEKKRLQEIEEEKERKKIKARVDALYQYNSLVPFFEVAMLTDGEYETMLQTAIDIHETEQKRLADEEAARKAEAIDIHETEQKRLADEEAARKAEADWLEKIRVDQEIEAARFQAAILAQEAKVQAENDRLQKIKDDLQAEKDKLEAEKKEVQDRKDREEFERKAKIEAVEQAKGEAEERKTAKLNDLISSRFTALKSVGHTYTDVDLAVMPEQDFLVLFAEKKDIWDAEQRAIQAEKDEAIFIQEKKEAAAEKQRWADLAPDKEKLLFFADQIKTLQTVGMQLKTDEAMTKYAQILSVLGVVEKEFRQGIALL
jgi:hypothetical protein